MPAETVSVHIYPGPRRTRRIEGEVALLAAKQHGVVGRGQLGDMGLSERAVEHRVAMGRLHPVARGVYAVGHKGISQLGRSMAAVLASGTGAVLSHRSAAVLWGIRGPVGGAVDVTVPRKSTSSDRIRRHLAVLATDEVTVCEGIAVTTAPRTIFDLAATSPVDRLEHDIRQLEYLRLYDRLSLLDLVERYPGRRGRRRVQAALTRIEALPAGRTRSRLEERFLPFLRRHGLPRPRLNDWIVVGDERFEVDCHWRDTGQVVELDSWEAHGTKSAFREDRARDRVLRTAGYDVTRISWAQLDDEPKAVAADLRMLLKRARAARRHRS